MSCTDGNNGDGDERTDGRDSVYRTQPVHTFSRYDRRSGGVLLRRSGVYDTGSHRVHIVATVTGLYRYSRA